MAGFRDLLQLLGVWFSASPEVEIVPGCVEGRVEVLHRVTASYEVLHRVIGEVEKCQ